MKDVQETRTGGETEVFSHLLHSPDGQKHSDGGTQREQTRGLELQLWVAYKGLTGTRQATDVLH